MTKRVTCCVISFMTGLVVASEAWGQQGGKSNISDPVAYYFPSYDKNNDGVLDRSEWGRRGNFELLDANRDGGIDRSEFAILYKAFGKSWQLTRTESRNSAVEMDTTYQEDLQDLQVIGKRNYCIVSRRDSVCPAGDQVARMNGLRHTGIGPIFPAGTHCLAVDESFAEKYDDKTGQEEHGGLDIPAPSGTPYLAIANGTVVAKIDNIRQLRGLGIVLRHSPADTGLPFWTYSEYAHLKEIPPLVLGQRVRMGDVVGLTGNTGVRPNGKSQTSERRPGIHFAIYYSRSSNFAVHGDYVVPQGVKWMDPTAIYRERGPYDTSSLIALPEQEKDVMVPHMMLDGSFRPQGTKLIWPFACRAAEGN